MCLIVLCCAWGSAAAEFSPLWTALTGGEGMRAEITGSFDALDPLSAQSLDTVNAWLSRLKLSLLACADGSGAKVEMDGETLFAVSIRNAGDGVVTAFAPSGGAYRTDAGEKDALQLLSGGADWSIPNPAALPDCYLKLAEKLYPLLAEYVTPKTILDSTSVKNAMSSQSYVNYVFKEEELNEAWPRVLEILLPALREALQDQPGWYEAAEKVLSTLTFFGDCRFKRLLDKNGGDMGLQFTGQVAAEGLDKRKATLFGGFTPGRGGYISLSLPAVKGKNSLKISFGARLTASDNVNTLTFDGSYARTLDGAAESAEMEATVKNTVKNGAEQWSGKVTVSASLGGSKAAWTITPALEGKDGALTGTVTVQKKVGSAVKLKGTMQVLLTPAIMEASADAGREEDLRGLDEAAARARVLQEMTPLSRMLVRLMAALPEGERALLTHDLRTDAWMNGPLVTVSDGEPETEDESLEEYWIVVEEE